MHGDDHLGLNLIHEGLGLRGADGVKAPHGDHGHVQPGQVRQLGGGELAADVPQVGHPQLARLEHMDGVGTPQGAPLGVVEGLNGGDGEGIFVALQGTDHVGGVVVVVLGVGAQHQVGGHIQRAEAGDVVILIGVKHHGEALAGQFKAGVAVPAQFQLFHRKASFMCG